MITCFLEISLCACTLQERQETVPCPHSTVLADKMESEQANVSLKYTMEQLKKRYQKFNEVILQPNRFTNLQAAEVCWKN